MIFCIIYYYFYLNIESYVYDYIIYNLKYGWIDKTCISDCTDYQLKFFNPNIHIRK
jgi:hypothetical protein